MDRVDRPRKRRMRSARGLPEAPGGCGLIPRSSVAACAATALIKEGITDAVDDAPIELALTIEPCSMAPATGKRRSRGAAS